MKILMYVEGYSIPFNNVYKIRECGIIISFGKNWNKDLLYG